MNNKHIVLADQQYINFLQSALLICVDFIEEEGLAEEYGKWLVNRPTVHKEGMEAKKVE